jgi:hypothetical protein
VRYKAATSFDLRAPYGELISPTPDPIIMFLRTAVLSLAALAAAKEMPKDEFKAAELFDSGIRHENNKALKLVSFA